MLEPLDITVAVALSGVGVALALGCARLLRERLTERRFVRKPEQWPTTATAWRAGLRVRPMAFAVLLMMIAGVVLVSLVPGLDRQPFASWIGVLSIAGALGAMLVGATVFLLNWPKWVVPSAFWGDRAALFEWHAARQRWRRAIQDREGMRARGASFVRLVLLGGALGLIVAAAAPSDSIVWALAIGFSGQAAFVLLTYPLVKRSGWGGTAALILEQSWPVVVFLGGFVLPDHLYWVMFLGAGGLGLHLGADELRRLETPSPATQSDAPQPADVVDAAAVEADPMSSESAASPLPDTKEFMGTHRSRGDIAAAVLLLLGFVASVLAGVAVATHPQPPGGLKVIVSVGAAAMAVELIKAAKRKLKAR